MAPARNSSRRPQSENPSQDESAQSDLFLEPMMVSSRDLRRQGRPGQGYRRRPYHCSSPIAVKTRAHIL